MSWLVFKVMEKSTTKVNKNIEQYIDLVYSQKSVLNNIPDLDERKKVACERVKLDYASESVQDILNMKNQDVNDLIFHHLCSKNPNDYILLIADEHLFSGMMKRLMKPLTDDEDEINKDLDLKTKMSEKAKGLLERINERRLLIFMGESESKMAEEKIRIMRPEDRLKKRSA